MDGGRRCACASPARDRRARLADHHSAVPPHLRSDQSTRSAPNSKRSGLRRPVIVEGFEFGQAPVAVSGKLVVTSAQRVHQDTARDPTTARCVWRRPRAHRWGMPLVTTEERRRPRPTPLCRTTTIVTQSSAGSIVRVIAWQCAANEGRTRYGPRDSDTAPTSLPSEQPVSGPVGTARPCSRGCV